MTDGQKPTLYVKEYVVHVDVVKSDIDPNCWEIVKMRTTDRLDDPDVTDFLAVTREVVPYAPMDFDKFCAGSDEDHWCLPNEGTEKLINDVMTHLKPSMMEWPAPEQPVESVENNNKA